ncbi:MAG: hypothetical protein ACK4NS_06110 [Saprospiraceae bacterium]
MAFGPGPSETHPPDSGKPQSRPFRGYSFLDPNIVDVNAAYAPYLLDYPEYYRQNHFSLDIEKQKNIEEWQERFCGYASAQEIEAVVYETDFFDLERLRVAAEDPLKKKPLPYKLQGNLFAELIVQSGCKDVAEYLMFTRKCEPHVARYAGPENGWRLPERDKPAMRELIAEGENRLIRTESHFLRLRYAFQIIRLAHYAGDAERVIALYNELMPKVDVRKPSIIYYWIMSHLAGALQRTGRYPEAAVRFALVFRHSPSKREQAFRSWAIRNDDDWKKSFRLCKSDQERATFYILRAAQSRSASIEDMLGLLSLDPGNPNLDLMLYAAVHRLERLLLRNEFTERKYGLPAQGPVRQAANRQLLDLQKFISQALRNPKLGNPSFWTAMAGYAATLAGDHYNAERFWKTLEAGFDDRKKNTPALRSQIAAWRLLGEILRLNPRDTLFRDAVAFRIKSRAAYRDNPDFEPFLKDWLGAQYAAAGAPGKALLFAYGFKALGYNPQTQELDDLLNLLQNGGDPTIISQLMSYDTSLDAVRDQLLEMKGVHLLSIGEREAALSVMRQIPETRRIYMTRFIPFREEMRERVHSVLAASDSLQLNRIQIIEQLMDYEYRAKSAAALKQPEAARYYYLIGLAYYNMSYFGHAWKAADFYRSGYNWNRLPQGPVFPLKNSPAGNRENTLMIDHALRYFELAIANARDTETYAKSLFMAARCRQKQWFREPATPYKPGSKLIPVLPPEYMTYYNLLAARCKDTEFYKEIIQECKWFAAYARGM